jgi:alkaline phosphatase D
MKILIFIIFFISIKTYYIQEGNDPTLTITNFTFGSNYYGRYLKEEDIFKTILEHNPNLWIWLGNAVYLDKPQFNYFKNTPELSDWNFIKILYKKAKSNKYYQELCQKIPVIGTWGDEEYGILNGNEENELKESFKQYYLDFLDVDTLDQRRNYVNLGLYSTYSFGTGYKTVRFILLDLKYNQTWYFKEEKKYDMLGEDQWRWLENIFKNTKESYTFICMSNQILPYDKFITENWYSESRKRLFDLIGKYQRNGVIFLSGGIGFAQILKTFCPLPKIGYNLYEFTSSGLSYSNKFKSYINNIYESDYLIKGKNYNGINFGQVKINWGSKNDINNSYVEFEIYDNNNSLVADERVNYTQLLFNNDTKDFYLDENNMKNIRYMNVYDGKSCEREIYHRVRTPFMNLKYYLTNLKQLPIAIITTVLIILIPELLYHKRFILVLLLLIIPAFIYCVSYLIDLGNYYEFKRKILNN